ncbi:uncharacterized protein FIBRA_08608 [Fibroporia radiculosa]|uniref:Uncharacterized protein n=1 Tax=Fibroporia radiculosa TaxID=599839 RepID=J4ICG1_9APHY|nr:uncharacterized protein FIBRA_08608 [Fibroporia radiculosa]CCM06351.1 predicted protein [Fibroporia radiculosa]
MCSRDNTDKQLDPLDKVDFNPVLAMPSGHIFPLVNTEEGYVYGSTTNNALQTCRDEFVNPSLLWAATEHSYAHPAYNWPQDTYDAGASIPLVPVPAGVPLTEGEADVASVLLNSGNARFEDRQGVPLPVRHGFQDADDPFDRHAQHMLGHGEALDPRPLRFIHKGCGIPCDKGMHLFDPSYFDAKYDSEYHLRLFEDSERVRYLLIPPEVAAVYPAPRIPIIFMTDVGAVSPTSVPPQADSSSAPHVPPVFQLTAPAEDAPLCISNTVDGLSGVVSPKTCLWNGCGALLADLSQAGVRLHFEECHAGDGARAMCLWEWCGREMQRRNLVKHGDYSPTFRTT